VVRPQYKWLTTFTHSGLPLWAQPGGPPITQIHSVILHGSCPRLVPLSGRTTFSFFTCHAGGAVAGTVTDRSRVPLPINRSWAQGEGRDCRLLLLWTGSNGSLSRAPVRKIQSQIADAGVSQSAMPNWTGHQNNRHQVRPWVCVRRTRLDPTCSLDGSVINRAWSTGQRPQPRLEVERRAPSLEDRRSARAERCQATSGTDPALTHPICYRMS
jgi:hypothetical protein